MAEYPKNVVYCPNCGYPPDLCEYSGKFEGCKPWLIANYPHLYPQLAAAAGAGAAAGAPQAAGGDASGLAAKMASATLESKPADAPAEPAKKEKKEKAPKGPKVYVEVRQQGRRKVTTVTGMEAFTDAKLKEVGSALGKKFGAGASVGKSATGVAQIDIQGDVAYELPELLMKLYNVPEKSIDVKALDD